MGTPKKREIEIKGALIESAGILKLNLKMLLAPLTFIPNIGIVINPNQPIFYQPSRFPQDKSQTGPKGKITKKNHMHENHRAGDWVCLVCNNLNYSFRKVCNRCQLQTKKQNLLQSLNIMEDPRNPNCIDQGEEGPEEPNRELETGNSQENVAIVKKKQMQKKNHRFEEFHPQPDLLSKNSLGNETGSTHLSGEDLCESRDQTKDFEPFKLALSNLDDAEDEALSNQNQWDDPWEITGAIKNKSKETVRRGKLSEVSGSSKIGKEYRLFESAGKTSRGYGNIKDTYSPQGRAFEKSIEADEEEDSDILRSVDYVLDEDYQMD